MKGYIEQRLFPVGGPKWLHATPDLSGWKKPKLKPLSGEEKPILSVIGTVRDERIPFKRSWKVWAQQKCPYSVEYWVLDDGSSDNVVDDIKKLQDEGAPIRYALFREPGDLEDRSCTLLFNAAIRGLVKTPLCMIQWWDRIPGSFQHLTRLIKPHLEETGIVTSAVSRHIGGSSSVHEMKPGELASILGTVDWAGEPRLLERIAGPTGTHCIAGRATESSGFIFRVEDFKALGGYDERYVERAGYSNVELFRRILQADLSVRFVPEPHGSNYHQSHKANRDKHHGWLSDGAVVRNKDTDWGKLEPIEVI